MDYFQNVTAWLAQPFNEKGNALQWFLFVGLIIAALYAWHMVLRDVGEVSGELS